MIIHTHRIALGIEYDGSAYHGWQIQPTQNTVEGQINRALTQIANTPIKVTCAGRTDVGVHAKGQVAHFDTHAERPLDAWVRGVNSLLPPDIAIQWARIVPDTFHARFSAKSRSYRYVIYNMPTRSALYARQMTWYRHPLNHVLMNEAAQYFIGTHDFSALRDADCQAKTPIRTISKIDISRADEFITVHITANAFLHHMVRNLMGVLLPIGSGLQPPRWADEVLKGKDRKQAGITAPSQGLTLMAVEYDGLI
ncbi:MAG TPA: tRNA pseudouridine(38-40) synthase TruA [Gammaproteobacteria bacterium]|nr:tRNA pseudouridine(38-40) synthase TruA [Gammaproteobacteria bacterium]